MSLGLVFATAVLLSGCGGGSGGGSTPPPRVAFLSNRTGNFDIYITTLAPGFPTVNLTNHLAGDDEFCWSPTGNQLAFLSNRSGAWELWIINADGTGATQLTSTGGTKADPAWSPVGNKIAFVHNSDICVYDFTTNTTQNLTAGNGTNVMPCWSPSGNQIVFASDRAAGNWDIWVMNADGANPTQLTNNIQVELRPVWSPNGQKIAFERGSDVWVMDANGASPLNLTNGVGAFNGLPTWSPNSQSIAFVRDGDIYRINANGTGLTQLTTMGSCLNPHWSKSAAGNSAITFMSASSGNLEIYVMAPDGTGITNISSNAAAVDRLPIWAP
jgi:Tol biopolymer transport system component